MNSKGKQRRTEEREGGTKREEGDNGVIDREFQRRKMGENPVKATTKKMNKTERKRPRGEKRKEERR